MTEIITAFTILFGSIFLNLIVHELGHAIPILYWSRRKVAIFIGSFGDEKASFRWPVGRLDMFILKNPIFWWRGACCRPAETLSPAKQMVYVAAGPIASLGLTLICWLVLWITHPETHLKWTLLCIGYIGACTVLGSLIPGVRARWSKDGRRLYNDVTLFYRIWKQRTLPAQYWDAVKYVKEKKFSEGAQLLEAFIAEGHTEAMLLRLTVGAHLMERNFERAGELNETIRKKYGFDADDHINAGYLFTQHGQHEEAIACYSRAMEKDSDHPLALNNFGYTLVVLDKPQESIAYFDKAIGRLPRLANPYSGRAWAWIKLGEWEKGLADVTRSLELDKNHAEAYRILGIHHLSIGSAEAALGAFQQAKQLDNHLLFVDDDLTEAKRRLATRQ